MCRELFYYYCCHNSRELAARGLYDFSFQLNNKLKAYTMPPTSYANANLAGVEKFYLVREK